MPICIWSYGSCSALIKRDRENKDLREVWGCFLGFAIGFCRL